VLEAKFYPGKSDIVSGCMEMMGKKA
jgi:hypothetical protein